MQGPKSTTIASIKAYQIYDSRGKPTIEVALETADGNCFRSAVPSGASTGSHEALELRDLDSEKFLGQGVSKAIDNVNKIIVPKFLSENIDPSDQKAVDSFLIGLDGTKNKDNLGANAILGVSMVICQFAAASRNIPLYQHIAELFGNKIPQLPLPFLNVINGGAHAGNILPFQEFMIVPTGARSFDEAMMLGSETYQHLKALIKKRHGVNAVNVGDEGGFAPNVSEPVECLDLLMEAIRMAGHEGLISIALDVAASEFHCADKPGYYNLDVKNPTALKTRIISGLELGNIYAELCEKYPIVSIEDPFDQDDWESWIELRRRISAKVQIVGDDLTVTNPNRVSMAIELKACNSLLLKINQIGTISESLQAAKLAMENGWSVMVSHRSGETEDSFIADLSTGIGCGQIKSGAPCRSERLAKYNRLLRIQFDGVSLKNQFK